MTQFQLCFLINILKAIIKTQLRSTLTSILIEQDSKVTRLFMSHKSTLSTNLVRIRTLAAGGGAHVSNSAQWA